MATSEEKETAINSLLDKVDSTLEDGPEDNETTSAFLTRAQTEALALADTISTLTDKDVGEIWAEGESEDESEDGENDAANG